MAAPAVALAVLSIIGGYDQRWLLGLLGSALPSLSKLAAGAIAETVSSTIASGAFLTGVLAAWLVYLRQPGIAEAVSANPVGGALYRWWFADWGMDRVYDRVLVRPLEWLARANRNDILDSIYDGIAALAALCWRGLSLTETGSLRWYATVIAAGTVLFVAMVMFL